MKKYISYLAFALFAVFSLSLASCGDDDEPDNPDKPQYCGKIVEKRLNTSRETTYYAFDGEWKSGHTGVVGTGIYDFSDGATFIVYLYETQDVDEWTIHDVYWMIKVKGEIATGNEVTIHSTSWAPMMGYSSTYSCEDTEGSVKVKSIKGSNITLEFKDFKFDYYIDFTKTTDIAINGDITFAQKEED